MITITVDAESIERSRMYHDLKATVNSLKRIRKKRQAKFGAAIQRESSDYFDTQNYTEEQKETLVVNKESQNSVLNVGQDTKLHMNNFLKRPVEIYSTALPLGTIPGATELKVWNLFTIEPSVRAKLRNYAYLRGNLHLRAVISGTPFHQGRVLLSYQPHASKNVPLNALLTTASRNCITGYLSQSPYSAIMNVNCNEPAHIVCPYIGQKVNFRLYNRSAAVLSSVSPYADLENAGSLFIYLMNPIDSVSATPSQVYIQVYAWMEDVELGVSTASQTEIQTESSDEYEAGPVEKLATKAADLSAAFEKVPLIGQYATPSKMMFTGMADLASVLGFSKPPAQPDITFVKNRSMEYGAQCIGRDSTARITIDPKQELTVSPSIVNRGDDEMTIQAMCSRPSFINFFNWTTTQAPLGSSMFKCSVTPQLAAYQTAGLGYQFQPSAMDYAVSPFGYWRGDITFKIEVVCSAYHTGKLLIYFEPNASQEPIIDPDIDLNKNYVTILDLSESDTIEFTVNWAIPEPWARTSGPTGKQFQHGALFDPSLYEGWINGYIGVVPFTRLQAPDSGSVEVNIYAWCENMHVNYFTEGGLPTRRIINESSDWYEAHTQDKSKRVILNETSATTDEISSYFFGEEPLSFRTLLKRFSTVHLGSVSAGIAGDLGLLYTFQNLREPVHKYTGSSGFDQENLMSYLRYAFIGVRGGTRYRIFNNNVIPRALHNRCTVTMNGPQSPSSDTVGWTTTSPSAMMRGTISIQPDQSGALEFEVPYYSSNLFSMSFSDDGRGPIAAGEAASTYPRAWVANVPADYTQATTHVRVDAAGAEDLCYFGFQGAPFYYV